MGREMAESLLRRVRAVEAREGAPMKLHFAADDSGWTACGLYRSHCYTRDIAQFRAEEQRCKQCERRKVVLR